ACWLTGAGRSHPGEVAPFPGRRDESPEALARRAGEHALAAHEGAVLVFLPGRREIARLLSALSPSPAGVKPHGLRATGARAAERPPRCAGPGPGAGVGVRVRRSDAGLVADEFANPTSGGPSPPR